MKFLILSAVLFSIYFIVYKLLFTKSRYFGLNRFMLLLLPLASILWYFFPTEIEHSQVATAQLDEIVISSKSTLNTMHSGGADGGTNWIFIYWMGVAASSFILLYRLLRTNYGEKSFAFSFFRKVFVPKLGDRKVEQTIKNHEDLHASKLHSIDVMLAELYACLFWFNPINRWYVHQIKLNHEYEVDAAVSQLEPEYSKILVARHFKVDPLVLGHSFNNSNLKNRLKMMKQKKQKSTLLLLAAFLGIVSIGFWSCSKEEIKETAEANTFTKEGEASEEKGMSEKNSATVPDKMPQFPGGQEAMIAYMIDNIAYPESEKENGTEGKVIVSFMVMEDGSVAEATVVKGMGPAFDQVAVDAVSNMPNWTPAEKDGKSIKTELKLPIQFKLD
jgi:TonB family protein